MISAQYCSEAAGQIASGSAFAASAALCFRETFFGPFPTDAFVLARAAAADLGAIAASDDSKMEKVINCDGLFQPERI